MSNVQQINGVAIQHIVSRLREKGAAIERAAKQALRDGAAEIVNDAKSRCPVKTGKLKNSIHYINENDGITIKIVADAKNEQGKPYAKIVEHSPKINHPFLYPAIDAQKNNLSEKIKSAVRGEI